MRSWLFLIFGVIIAAIAAVAIIYSQNTTMHPQDSAVSISTSLQTSNPLGTASPAALPEGPSVNQTPTPTIVTNMNTTNTSPDLSVDANGLSKASVVLTTSQGVIKYKFYTNDAPKTVKRMVELINSGFYNGLTFHRVVPGFVIQGGDPIGNGTGGSGQKLEAEFNSRKHVEGTLAMARSADPNSADSQFYVSLGTHPHLDNSYTIFGQVIEGMDVAKKIKAGDKIVTATIQ